MKDQLFRDQVAIVTGASAGIGKALALLLARHGAKVAVAARRLDRLETVVEECHRLGTDALAVQTDVSRESQCSALVDKTISSFGRLDLLVCNAGIAASALFQDFEDLSLFRKTVDINLYGAVFCTYYALPHLRQSRGRIVAVSSLGGKTAIPYNTPYCTSKYGMHGFFDALRMEVARQGVSVTVVCPWWVATEFHTAQLDQKGMPRGEERGKDLYTSRTMSAERCAQIILSAAFRRRREVLMGPGKLAVWLKTLAPGFLDWMAIKVFLEPAARRAAQRRDEREALTG